MSGCDSTAIGQAARASFCGSQVRVRAEQMNREGYQFVWPGGYSGPASRNNYIPGESVFFSGHARRRSMRVLMMRALSTRSTERVDNSFAHSTAVDAALVAVCLLTVGLLLLPARAGAQSAS